MNIRRILDENRDAIVTQCAHAILEQCGQRYSQQSFEQLTQATLELVGANFAAIVKDDFSEIDSFIERITSLRLASGFTLSEIQHAFDIHRIVLVPILAKELSGSRLIEALNKLNFCLSYTIRKFSDYYQDLHEKRLREYAHRLERQVARRTRELSASEAKYRTLVEEMNDGYFISLKGRVVFANIAFCDMHGYKLQEVIGRAYLDFVAPESPEMMNSIFSERSGFRKIPDQCTYNRMHKDGRSLPTENKVKIMRYRNRLAVAGVCRDITERIKMERRVREAENLAHIGQLTASLAHEIRNPLSSIKMSIQMALQTIEFDKSDLETMEISAREIVRLENILSEMLDFAKPLSLNLEKGSVNEVIDSALDLLNIKIREKNITVKRRFSKRIPRVSLDREKMEQVTINIVLNAVEELPAGGTILITTKYKRANKSEVCLNFSDNGPGMNQETALYAFDPFFSKKKKGTGLGLANVKKVIEAHGGTVAIERAIAGFSLSVKLPIYSKGKNG